MKLIRLEQHALKIQLTEALLLLRRSLRLEYHPLVVLIGDRVASLADRYAQSG